MSEQTSLPIVTKDAWRLRYKFIHFKFCRGTTWQCLSNKNHDLLGFVVHYRPWRQYIFQPEPNTVFSIECLHDIQDFMAALARDAK